MHRSDPRQISQEELKRLSSWFSLLAGVMEKKDFTAPVQSLVARILSLLVGTANGESQETTDALQWWPDDGMVQELDSKSLTGFLALLAHETEMRRASDRHATADFLEDIYRPLEQERERRREANGGEQIRVVKWGRGWVLQPKGYGWIFEQKFSTKWRAKLALHVWREGGRVTDYSVKEREQEAQRGLRNGKATPVIQEAPQPVDLDENVPTEPRREGVCDQSSPVDQALEECASKCRRTRKVLSALALVSFLVVCAGAVTWLIGFFVPLGQISENDVANNLRWTRQFYAEQDIQGIPPETIEWMIAEGVRNAVQHQAEWTRRPVQRPAAIVFWVSGVIWLLLMAIRGAPGLLDDFIAMLPLPLMVWIPFVLPRWRVSVVQENGAEATAGFFRWGRSAVRAGATAWRAEGGKVNVTAKDPEPEGLYRSLPVWRPDDRRAAITLMLGIVIGLVLFVFMPSVILSEQMQCIHAAEYDAQRYARAWSRGDSDEAQTLVQRGRALGFELPRQCIQMAVAEGKYSMGETCIWEAMARGEACMSGPER